MITSNNGNGKENYISSKGYVIYKENNDENCIDESSIDVTSACIEIYDPVCGCNGITYPNSCYAITFNGIKSFTKGACN